MREKIDVYNKSGFMNPVFGVSERVCNESDVRKLESDYEELEKKYNTMMTATATYLNYCDSCKLKVCSGCENGSLRETL